MGSSSGNASSCNARSASSSCNASQCANLDRISGKWRAKEISAVPRLSAFTRKAGINLHILQAKIRRETPLTATGTAALVAAHKRFRLATLA
jgi:hypothetical protein